jgi:membrane protease subunit HflK
VGLQDMGWDEGDNNKRNPWNSGDGKGPADLDALVRDFQRRLRALFGGGGRGERAPRGGGAPLGAGLVAAVVVGVLAIWGLAGFYKVDDAEQGIVLRFGAYHDTTMPGLRWHLPWPIERVEKVNASVTESFAYQGSMLTRDENIVLVDLIVQYRRADPHAYLFNLRSPDDALRDVTASAIREVIGKNDLDFILTEGRIEVAARTQELIQSTLDAYGTGITVYEVNLQEANFPRDVEASVQDAIKAREDRERMSLEAQTYANDLLPRARGAAERQRQDAEAYRTRAITNAEGESDRFMRIMSEYQKSPRVTRERLYLETIEQILAGATKVLIDTEGNGNMIYLPLDRLLERRGTTTVQEMAPVDPVPKLTAPAPSTARERVVR